ncbi:MAG: ATP-dependent helicase [Deltaproteobacteria bacterium]|nr:ATP-dependent helicase [Deltaproteobacteria bacterium]
MRARSPRRLSASRIGGIIHDGSAEPQLVARRVLEKRYSIREIPAPGGKIDYEKALNPRQAEAVLHGDGPLLVVAGAGTGKTRTLIYRVARLVELGHTPSSILLLTFTRRASEEMLRRAALLLDRRCEKVAGGTFHAFANSLLRRYASAAGFGENFTILDRADAQDLIGLLRHEIHAGHKTVRFPKKETLADLFSRAVNREEEIEPAVEREAPHFLYCLGDILAIQRLYERTKRERNLMDYDDLLVRLVALLRENEPIRRAVSETYRHVLVDEYQDTNRIQAEILRLLAAAHDNVMAVGDDSQSIYSFRGANFRNIMDFPADFPGAKVVFLEENYRSRQPILDVTNEIIARAAEKFPKRLFTSRSGGEKAALLSAPNERIQSAFVADRILELHEEQGIPLSEIAVLFRAAYLSFDLELELAKRHIPYRKFGGFKFLETAHVKDVIAHLRVIDNPRDTLSLSRALMLVPGIGRKVSADLYRRAHEEASLLPVLSTLKKRRGSEEASLLAKLLSELSGREAGGQGGTLPVTEIVARVIGYYRPLMEGRFDDYPRRLKDLDHLESLCARYKTLSDFLSEITLEPPQASVGDIAAPEGEEESLTLSTIHSAKGLEWKAVFIVWVLDGKLPLSRAAEEEEEMEEERRLLYVAATRAKDVLVMTYPVNIYERASGTVLSRPSRFVEEIPAGVLPRFALIE